MALRVRNWIGVSTGLRGASPRSNGVDGTRSTPRMRTTSSTTSALPCTSAPPRRHRDLHPLALAGDEEAEPLEHAAHFRQRHGEAGEALELGQRKIDDALGRFGAAGDGDLRRRAAAQVEHHAGREFEPRQHEGRIDAALEAIARVGIDAELAAGLGDVDLGSHSADSISTSVVASEQPVFSPPMMPASDSTPSSSAMTHMVSSSA